MPQFEMRPFHPAEAETIAHWIASPDDVWRLTGTRDFAVNAEKIVSWTWEVNFTFTLRSHGDLIAYGEIVEDEVDGDVEIQHLLVAPDLRGRGYGRAMLSRLCAFLAAARPYPEVWMRSGRDNEPAAKCAESIGFVLDEKMSGPRYAWYKKSLARESSTAQLGADAVFDEPRPAEGPRVEEAKPAPDNSRLREEVQRELDSLEQARESRKQSDL